MELEKLKGVGEVTLKKLNKAGISTLEDVVMHLPTSYVDYSLKTDFRLKQALIEVLPLTNVGVKELRNHNSMQIFTGLVNKERVKFLAFGKKYLNMQIHKNRVAYIYGGYKEEYNYFLVERVFDSHLPRALEAHYDFKDIKDNNYSKIVYSAFNHLDKPLERLPKEIVNKYNFLDFSSFLIKAHFPLSLEDLEAVKRRKIYEKFFWHYLAISYLKNKRSKAEKPIKCFDNTKIAAFIKSLPYTLTKDQSEVSSLILAELASEKRVNRLIEGDVGCGKTIVAFIAAYASILAGYQVAFIAPTEILARQHYLHALELFKDLNIRLLISKLAKNDRAKLLEEIEAGRANLIIGTHAIIEDSVKFKSLGLLIIDEQQRFGVKERSKLQKDYPLVDSLYFSATPIPRTLGLTMYGDLDLSLIKELPQGRIPVKTRVLAEDKLELMCDFINKRIELGEQIFIVVPLILESESLNLWNITDALRYFSEHLRGKINVIHGKTKKDDKEAIMNDFKNHSFDVLLSTTMIEVGIDIPNATVLVLMNAERFGLSSSHQLRGRVGRGNKKSYFFLVSNDINNKRLEVLETTSDGFKVAEEDFKLRGPGDYLGRRQSGYFSLIEKNDLDFELKVLEYAKKDAINEALKIDKNNNDYIINILDSLNNRAQEDN